MNHISSQMPPDNRSNKCGIPACQKSVAKPGGPLDVYETYLCAEHVEKQKAYDAKKREEDHRVACNKVYSETLLRVDLAIPALFSDVPDPTVGTNEERDAAYALLASRVECADLGSVIRATSEAADALIAKRGTVVLFAGVTGTGKSTLAACLLRMMLNRIPRIPLAQNPLVKKGGLFGAPWDHDGCDPFVLWKSAESLFAAEAKRDEETVRDAMFSSLAVLDDIGNEPTQANIKTVHSVIWQRREDMKATVLTSGWVDPNASPADLTAFLAPLARRYDDAFLRRVALDEKFCRVITLTPVP